MPCAKDARNGLKSLRVRFLVRTDRYYRYVCVVCQPYQEKTDYRYPKAVYNASSGTTRDFACYVCISPYDLIHLPGLDTI